MSTWILILMTNWHGHFDGTYATTAVPVTVTSIEFNSKESCVQASKFIARNKKVYSANCVKK